MSSSVALLNHIKNLCIKIPKKRENEMLKINENDVLINANEITLSPRFIAYTLYRRDRNTDTTEKVNPYTIDEKGRRVFRVDFSAFTYEVKPTDYEDHDPFREGDECNHDAILNYQSVN